MTAVSMPQESAGVIVGVDTHADVHVAAAIDSVGRMLGLLEIPTSVSGYRRLLRWAQSFTEQPAVFGVEGTGSYGAGLARYLTGSGCTVFEISRPDRRTRRAHGKSDPVDAEAAARAVLAGETRCLPKADDDYVGMIRRLRIARRSALKMRTQALNQMDAVILTAPDALRHRLRDLSSAERVRVCAGFRPGTVINPVAATKLTLQCLAVRCLCLGDELEVLNAQLDRLTAEAAPALVQLPGVGQDVAGALLVTAGDNPQRMRSEAAFASLCGVSPVQASSGKTHRHRLNRGGDRTANNALWRIVIVRLRFDERSRRYMARRTAEGLSKREVIRCLKRHVAREVYAALVTGYPRTSGSALDGI